MAEPILTFAFNFAGSDIPWTYNGIGDPNIDGYRTINPNTDLLVWTGGGILGSLPTPTPTSGSSDATLRPSTSSFVIPQLFVEQDIMYHASLAGYNTNRYALAVRVDGTATSDLYLESWSDSSMSSTAIEILTGTANSGNNSFINAIRTTSVEPPWPWDGASSGAAYLRGTEHRVALNNTATITDSTVYYNIFVELPTDYSSLHIKIS